MAQIGSDVELFHGFPELRQEITKTCQPPIIPEEEVLLGFFWKIAFYQNYQKIPIKAQSVNYG